MAYKALYRTYRPSTFSEVAGQNHIKKTLQNALKANKISHAYLFSGPRGIGKTTIARLLAKAVNCANAPTKEPCNQCASCLSIMYNQSTDIIELDAASNNGVEEIRQILEKVNYLPSNSKFKVYIIDEVHMLSTSAFNALLKTLEEPPAHVIFILATTEAHKIPMTIISRCQRFDFKALSSQEIKTKLIEVTKREAIKVKDDALDAIAETAEGGMRDALSILDQSISYSDDVITIDDVNSVTGRISNYKLIDLVNSFEGGNAANAIKIVDEILELGKEVNRLVGGLLTFCRDILLYQNTTDKSVFKYIFDNPEFKKLASSIDKKRVYFYIDVIMDIQNKLRYSNNPRIYLEVGVMKIINMTYDDLDISNKIKQLEERLFQGRSGETPQGTGDYSKIDKLDAKINKVINELSKLELYELKKKVEALENKNETPIDSNVLEQIQEMKKAIEKSKSNPAPTPVDSAIQEEIIVLKEKMEKLEAVQQEMQVFEIPEVAPAQTADTSGMYEQIEAIKNNILSIKKDQEQILLAQKTTANVPGEENLFSLEPKVQQEASSEKLELIESEQKNLLIKIQNLTSSYLLMEEDIKLAIENATSQSDENSKLLAELNLKWTTESNELLKLIDGLKNTMKDMLVKVNAKFDQIDEKDSMFEKLDVKLAQLSEYTKRLGSKLSEVEGRLQIVASDSQSTLSMFENISKSESMKKEEPIIKYEELVVKHEEPLVKKEEKPIIVAKSHQVELEINHQPTKKEEPISEISSSEPKNPYDISHVENILHDSRSEEAKTDRAKIMSEWRTLDKGISISLTKIAQLLMSATVSAIGKNAIIITYPSVSMCNHVMSKKFKEDAYLVFKSKIGKKLEYIALPNEIWLEKRNEYVGQYNMGVKFPKLKPLDNPDLKVVEESESPFLNEKNKAVEKAKSLFGDGLVKIEE